MAPLFILVISIIVLRAVRTLGARKLSSWREAGLTAVVIMFLFTGSPPSGSPSGRSLTPILPI